MDKQQSILYSKSYDLNIEVQKVLATLSLKDTQFKYLFTQVQEQASVFGISSYLAQEIAGKTSLGIRLYMVRKACYQSMYYLSLLRDIGAIDKKWAETVLERTVEILKLAQASITTLKKKAQSKVTS